MSVSEPETAPRISVVIPTYRRPDLLAAALASCESGAAGIGGPVEILVVDNAPEPEAEPVVAAAPRAEGVTLRYVHEPRPGISQARNRGVAEARADRIAFLDDDQRARPGWLAALDACLERTGADAAFGPVVADVAPGGDAEPREAEAVFSRRLDAARDADVTASHAFLGTQNSLFRRAPAFARPVPFDPELGTTGGEDSLLIKRLVLGGARFAWAADAVVDETVPADRATVAYLGRRRLRNGQIRCQVLARLEPPRRAEILRWMAVGAIQLGLWGALALLARPVDARRSARFGIRARGGLGKLIWLERFRRPMYGAAVTPPPVEPARTSGAE
ncbi:MAG: glycosyltransferase family A protein [Azospirillaceae bacterium]